MAWQQILGFFTMWLHPEITIGLWSNAGIPIWQTLSYVTLWTSITLSLTYFGIDIIKIIGELITKGIVWIIRLFGNDFKGFKRNHLQERNEKHSRKLTKWLGRQKKWVILVCSSVPFVPFFPAAIIITTKALKIKRGLLLLLIGNVFRNLFICYLIYYGLVKLQNLIKFFF